MASMYKKNCAGAGIKEWIGVGMSGYEWVWSGRGSGREVGEEVGGEWE